ncbi:uncharacterized protein [Eurosta solidaginis]|uniref:uncharacterized protein n=1 Tax=Eurosta solidaginis TaxID=178769 RepID=UPI003530E9DB
MNMTQFVAEVRKREGLWNRKKIPLNGDQRIVCEKLWVEVGKACKIPKETAKIKWRSLRDHFYKLLKMVPVYTTGDTYYIEENEKPNWPHFNNLMFLLNTYNPKQKVINIKDESIIDIRASSDSDSCDGDERTTYIEKAASKTVPPTKQNTVQCNTPLQEGNGTNISVVGIKEEPESACIETPVPIEDSLPPLAMVKPQLPVPAFTSIKRVYTLVGTDDLDVETRQEADSARPSKRIAKESNVNRSALKDSDDSADETENMAFFRSLLPFMKKLDPIQQLRVRMRCQESLLEEMGALNN